MYVDIKNGVSFENLSTQTWALFSLPEKELLRKWFRTPPDPPEGPQFHIDVISFSNEETEELFKGSYVHLTNEVAHRCAEQGSIDLPPFKGRTPPGHNCLSGKILTR